MAFLELDEFALCLREGDDVGVVKKTLKGGVELGNGKLNIISAATIPAGHKIALK